MRRLLAGICVVLVVGMIALSLFWSGPDVDDGSVLVLELHGAVEEVPATDALARLGAEGPALPTLLLLLEMAERDERIAGVLVHLRGIDAGYARVQELRGALGRVRAAGKTVVTLMDVTKLNATREYYLATASDRIYVDPAYLGPVAGVAGQYVHLGGFFERIGVQWQYARVGEYKSAVEMFAAREMSEPAREMAEEIIDGVYRQVVEGIAEGRQLEPAQVESLIDRAPGTAAELREAGLVDGTADLDDVLEQAGLADAERLSAGHYARVSASSVGLRDGETIALVFGDGNIVQSGSGVLSGGFETDQVIQAIETAAEDESVRAIVLRINSGGGSALASEQLWRVLRRVREDKPVVVSMGDAAASGGYYVASSADKIVAQPATLTGSIGVFLMRPAIEGLYAKLDIGTEVIARGDHATIAGSDSPLTQEQQKRTADYVDAVYRDFLGRVAEGRGSEPEVIDRVGQGHVWLGSAALEHALVDRLGGLHEAVELARQAAGLPDDQDPRRVIFPPPRSLASQLGELLGADIGRSLRAHLLPSVLPDVVSWALWPREGEIAYLPTHWIQIR